MLTSIDLFAAPENTSTVKIAKISGYETNATIEFTPEFTNSQNCTHSSIKNLAAITFENDKNNELYSLALSAAMGDKDVVLHFNGCHSSGVPSIYRVDVSF